MICLLFCSPDTSHVHPEGDDGRQRAGETGQRSSKLNTIRSRGYLVCMNRSFGLMEAPDFQFSSLILQYTKLVLAVLLQQGVLTFDPHPHELHAVVQRRLSAEQKQEVLLLRQHHGGKLEEKRRYLPLNTSSAFNQWMFWLWRQETTVSSLSRQHLNIRNVWGLKGCRTCSRCRRPSAAALWADVNLSLSRLMSSSVISSLWERHTLQPSFNSDLTEW